MRLLQSEVIRKNIAINGVESVENSVSEKTFKYLKKNLNEIVSNESIYSILRYKIISEKGKLEDIQDIESGFENRIYESALKNDNYSDFYKGVITKRYTNARVHRMLIHILLNIDKRGTSKSVERWNSYIRPLAFNKKGIEYLSKIKKSVELPVITNIKYITKQSDNVVDFFKLNDSCDKIYYIITGEKERNSPVLVEV